MPDYDHAGRGPGHCGSFLSLPGLLLGYNRTM